MKIFQNLSAILPSKSSSFSMFKCCKTATQSTVTRPWLNMPTNKIARISHKKKHDNNKPQQQLVEVMLRWNFYGNVQRPSTSHLRNVSRKVHFVCAFLSTNCKFNSAWDFHKTINRNTSNSHSLLLPRGTSLSRSLLSSWLIISTLSCGSETFN